MQRRNLLIKTGAALGVIGAFGRTGLLFAAEQQKIKPGPKDALIVVDVQNCFVDGGTLPVKGGTEIVPLINRLGARVRERRRHAGLAHAGPCVVREQPTRAVKPFSTTEMPYGTQVLWPDHCVQGTPDAALVDGLKLPNAELIIRKGFHKGVDSYSAFEEADRKTGTGLSGYLRERGIERLFITGTRNRLLRCLDRDGRTRARLRHVRGGRRDARDRPERLARRIVAADDGQGRAADQRGADPGRLKRKEKCGARCPRRGRRPQIVRIAGFSR